MALLLTPVKHVVSSTVLVVLALLGLSWPLIQQSYDEKFGGGHAPSIDSQSTITDYAATYRVAANGRLTATEVLTVDLPADRHGIFRFFPAADPTDPHARIIPNITGITMDHRPVPVSYSWRKDDTVYVAQIGDPEFPVSPGRHSYTIDYVIDGVLATPPAAPGEFTGHAGTNPGPPTASFYFNVVGFWAMRIDTAHVVIDLPGPAGLTRCAADATGENQCLLAGVGTNQLTVTAGPLPPHNPVTVRVDLQVPLPDRATLPWTVRFDRMLGRSLPTVRLVAVLALLGAASGWLWVRRSREPAPGSPVLYVPPDGLGPVQTTFIVNETVGDHALVATLLYMAERGLARLDRPKSTRWTITGIGTPEQWAATDAVTREVGAALGVDEAGGVFHAGGGSTAGAKLSAAMQQLESSCRSWSRGDGLVVSATGERVGRVLTVGCLVLAGVGFTGVFGPTMWGLPFAAFAIGGIGLLATGVGTRRTGIGRKLWSRAAGFERLLSTPSSADRFDYAARSDLFVCYLPYAVAFGVADRWAAKYRTATGAEPPTPTWYPARPSDGPATLYSAGGFGSFDAALAASISAYQSSQHSSGSGGSSFSSSGGSWGGGGGGGGGTW